MTQNPSSPNMNQEKKENLRLEAVLQKLRSIFLDNWGTKLLAVLIAIALWGGLITRDPSLTREKQFTDVDVSINGADTLKRYGYIVLEELDSLLDNVSMRVSVPQNQYAAAQSSNYSVRLDLSRIREAGTQKVKLLSTNTSTYGSVTEITPAEVELTVDEYVTRYRIPVTVVTKGEPPRGFYATAPSTDPPMVAVSGPKTVVGQIVSAQVVVDQSELIAREGTVRRALRFDLVDVNGKVIKSDMMEVTSESVLLDSIIAEQTIYTARTVDFSTMGLVTGEPAEGYEIKGVYISPPSVTIAGKAETINNMDVFYAQTSVNVKGLTESVNEALRLRQPISVKYVSTDVVNVAVEIGPIITSRAYEAEVKLQGLPIGLREVGGLRTATVHLTGAQPWLDTLSASALTLTCDLSSITEPGTYTLPLSCTVAQAEGQSYTYEIAPANVVVTVIAQ